MRVRVKSIFDCSPESARSEVQTPRLLLEIIRPLLWFKSPRTAPLPERWQQGATVVGRGIVLGVLPLGQHKLFFERVDPQTRQIQTRESNRWVRRWDHLISVERDARKPHLLSGRHRNPSRTADAHCVVVRPMVLPPPTPAGGAWRTTAPGRLISKSSRLPQGVDALPSFQHAAVRPTGVV